jgi:hypothetical protein
MATDLNDLIPALKRAVAVPGTFATFYPNTTNTDLVGSLMDAFGQAQIDGFFLEQTLDVDLETVDPDLSSAGQQVVVLYAAEAILRAQIMSLKQRVAYEAGPVKYETENSASVLTTILKDLTARRIAMQDQAAEVRRGATFAMQDMYADRVTGTEGVFIGAPVFYPYELAG